MAIEQAILREDSPIITVEELILLEMCALDKELVVTGHGTEEAQTPVFGIDFSNLRMKTPIILCEGLDVQFFETLEKAELEIEPIDALNGIYKIYDCEGLFLNAAVFVKKQNKKWWQIWKPREIESVKIEIPQVRIYKNKELKCLLSDFYRDRNIVFDESRSLEELVSVGMHNCCAPN